jgi:hypothetical protein
VPSLDLSIILRICTLVITCPETFSYFCPRSFSKYLDAAVFYSSCLALLCFLWEILSTLVGVWHFRVFLSVYYAYKWFFLPEILKTNVIFGIFLFIYSFTYLSHLLIQTFIYIWTLTDSSSVNSMFFQQMYQVGQPRHTFHMVILYLKMYTTFKLLNNNLLSYFLFLYLCHLSFQIWRSRCIWKGIAYM